MYIKNFTNLNKINLTIKMKVLILGGSEFIGK